MPNRKVSHLRAKLEGGTVGETFDIYDEEALHETVNNLTNSVTGYALDSVQGRLLNENVNALSARMDTFSSLPSGSTSGNAELIDIRVGEDGYTSASAGSSVRNQVNRLDDTIGYKNFWSCLYPITSNLNGLIFASEESTTYCLTLTPGDKLKIYTSGSYCVLNFFKSNPVTNVGNTIQRSSSYSSIITLQPLRLHEYTVPLDAPYITLSCLLSNVNRSPAKVLLNDVDISRSVNERLQDADEVFYRGDYKTQAVSTLPGVLTKIDLSTIENNIYSCCYYNVSPGDILKITGTNSIANFPLFILLNNGAVVTYPTDLTDQTAYVDYELMIPYGVDQILVNNNSEKTPTLEIKKLTKTSLVDYYDESVNYWKGKKIVWFGTSIPAGVVNAGDSGGNGAYPTRIGQMLGATVYNESLGSSEVRGGSHGTYVSSNDPNGYGAISAPGLFMSLSLSKSEKQTIYNAWNSKWKNIITWYQDQLDFTNKLQIYYNSSWDIKLAKYLTGGSVGKVDLYVFDHGYNDGVQDLGFTELSDDPPANNPTDRKYWIGAMNFLFKKILDDNPRARIVIIGHYNTDKNKGTNMETSYVCAAQKKLAESWGYPLIETWKHIGFSASHTANVSGTETPISQIWMPDDIHPSSDTSGKALQHYANVLYPLIRDIR